MLRRFRAVIFDLDDTLYAERDYVLSGYRVVANWLAGQVRVSAPQIFDDFLRILDDGYGRVTFACWSELHGLQTEEWVPKMLERFREHVPTIHLDASTAAVLDSLSRDYRLGLLTDGRAAGQEKKIAALNLQQWMSAIVLSDRLGRQHWKPSARPFMAVLEKLGVLATDSVYVGDNPLKDFIGARQLGLWTVRVRRPEGLYSHLPAPSVEYAAHVDITSLSQLRASLRELESMG